MDWQAEHYPKVFALLRNTQHYLGKTVKGSSELPSLTTTKWKGSCNNHSEPPVMMSELNYADVKQ